MILDDIAFRNILGKGEVIHYVAHKHAFVVYPRLFTLLLIGAGVPGILYFIFPPFYPIWIPWVCVGIFVFIYNIIQWYLDAWIITNYAVIDQDWKSYFDKSTTRIEYQSIEGVSTTIKGFWGTILGYGDIHIEHMSAEPVTLHDVSRPRKVERVLIQHQQDFLKRQNFQDQEKLKHLLTNLLRTGPE